MRLGYTILYVPDVARSLTFFEKAFGLRRRYVHASGEYAELDTGETTLTFASHGIADHNFPGGVVRADESPRPLGMKIALVTRDVQAAHDRALRVGAIELRPPRRQPWGQIISDLRTPDGCLVELCTPIEV